MTSVFALADTYIKDDVSWWRQSRRICDDQGRVFWGRYQGNMYRSWLVSSEGAADEGSHASILGIFFFGAFFLNIYIRNLISDDNPFDSLWLWVDLDASQKEVHHFLLFLQKIIGWQLPLISLIFCWKKELSFQNFFIALDSLWSVFLVVNKEISL